MVAATVSGLYLSSDFGNSWTSIRGNAVPYVFTDAAWSGGRLYASTCGQGVLASLNLLSVTPSSLNFGSVTVNTTTDLSFTVQNIGTGTLTGTAAASGAPFSVVAGSPFSLGP